MANENIDLPELYKENLTNEEEFLIRYNELVNQVNFLGKFMSFDAFNGTILRDISIPAGTQVEISHKLQVVPAYRVFLRCSGNSEICDGTVWNDLKVSFVNNGVTDAVITVVLLKG